MYNGIGLSSVRGSSTSGHVQTNRGHVGASRLRRQQERNAQDSSRPKYNPVSSAARKQGNAEIQKHEERRQIENQLLELQEEMEDAGQLNEEEIEVRIDRERKRLVQRLEDKANSKPHYNNREAHGQRWNRQQTAGNNHALKKQQNDRWGSALGIQQDSHVEGQAFDRELQDQKKAERQEKMEKERKVLEEEKKKREKEAKAEAKKRAKTEKKKKKKRRYSSSSDDSSSDESKGSPSDSSSSTSDRVDRKRRRRRSSSSASSN